VLVLTRASAIGYLSRVTVAPITSAIRGVPSEVVVGPDDGLKQPCAINLYNVVTVSKKGIGEIVHAGTESDVEAGKAALQWASNNPVWGATNSASNVDIHTKRPHPPLTFAMWRTASALMPPASWLSTMLPNTVERVPLNTSEEINKRFRAAKREIHMAKGSRAFDYMVINDDLEKCVEEVAKIIKHKRAGGI